MSEEPHLLYNASLGRYWLIWRWEVALRDMSNVVQTRSKGWTFTRASAAKRSSVWSVANGGDPVGW